MRGSRPLRTEKVKWLKIIINNVFIQNVSFIITNLHLKLSNICSILASQLAKILPPIPLIFSVWHYWSDWYVLKLSCALSMCFILHANSYVSIWKYQHIFFLIIILKKLKSWLVSFFTIYPDILLANWNVNQNTHQIRSLSTPVYLW